MRRDHQRGAAGNGNSANGNGNGTYLGACVKHFAARAVGQCEDCGELFCSQCIVPPSRKRQPTRCVECALIAAGVRAPGGKRNGVQSMSRARKSSTSFI